MAKQFSLAQRLRSFGFAGRGMLELLRTQHNAWIHALATLLVIVVGLLTGLDRTDWLFVIVACALVWVAEAFNTALEFLADALHTDFHPGIKRAKDVAAAAVLVAALAAFIIAIVIFIPLWSGD